MLPLLLYFSGMIFATAIVAIVMCRYRVARRKRISYGTLIASSAIPNFGIFLGLTLYDVGIHLINGEPWAGGKVGLGGILYIVTIIGALCLLPALAVALYYQSRSKRTEVAEKSLTPINPERANAS